MNALKRKRIATAHKVYVTPGALKAIAQAKETAQQLLAKRRPICPPGYFSLTAYTLSTGEMVYIATTDNGTDKETTLILLSELVG